MLTPHFLKRRRCLLLGSDLHGSEMTWTKTAYNDCRIGHFMALSSIRCARWNARGATVAIDFVEPMIRHSSFGVQSQWIGVMVGAPMLTIGSIGRPDAR